MAQLNDRAWGWKGHSEMDSSPGYGAWHYPPGEQPINRFVPDLRKGLVSPCCRLIFALCLIIGLPGQSQIMQIDRRKADEIIFLDVSASMVQDIRQGLAKMKHEKKRLATYDPKTDTFTLAKDVRIEDALKLPEIIGVVTNNLLHKAIQYIETMLDQPGPRRIYLSTFDDGPRTLGGTGAMADQMASGIFGPFLLEAGESEANAAVRSKIKTFLSPDRYGPYTGNPQWRGVLAETVTQGSGPTAIHRTCMTGLSFLKGLMVPGYTNTTRQQRMILFTDGEEVKDPQIPFTTTVSHFKLHQRDMPFEYTQIFIQPEGQALPPGIAKMRTALTEAGFPPIKVFPGTIRIGIAVDGGKLTGVLEKTEGTSAEVAIALSPSIEFSVESDTRRPIQGKLRFSVKALQTIEGMTAEVFPPELPVEKLRQPVNFQLTLGGKRLVSLFEAKSKEFTGLLLHWELIEESPPAARRNPNSSASGRSVAFSGRDWMEISLTLLPGPRPVIFRGLDPVVKSFMPGQRIEFARVPLTGTVARLEADFTENQDDAAVLAQLSTLTGDQSIRFATQGHEMTLAKRFAKEREGRTTQEFSLVANARPGSSNALVALKFIPRSKVVIPTPSNLELAFAFEPAAIRWQWLSQNGAETNHPAEIDFGVVRMIGVAAGTAKYDRPPVDSVILEVPPNAISPAGIWKITGPNAEAFRVVRKGDFSGEISELLESVKLEIQPRYFTIPTDVQVRSNLVATFEFVPKANFVSELRGNGSGLEQVRRVAVPLKMLAVIQPSEAGGANQ